MAALRSFSLVYDEEADTLDLMVGGVKQSTTRKTASADTVFHFDSTGAWCGMTITGLSQRPPDDDVVRVVAGIKTIGPA